MLVSIITATYNDQRFLRETIASVLNQDYADWEWIVVNNGSTDKTGQILEEIKDARVKVVRLPKNVGVSAGRNKAIELAKGDFLCFLDGDDILSENSIRSRVDVFNQSEEIEFVDGQVDSFKGSKENVVHSYTPRFTGNPRKELIGLTGKVFRGNTWMLKKVPNKRYQFREDVTHGEELLLYLELCGTGEYRFTQDVVLYYRQRNDSAMKNLKGLDAGYASILKFLKPLDHFSPEEKQRFRNRTRSIMFRSYLKQFKLIEAAKSWLKFSQF